MNKPLLHKNTSKQLETYLKKPSQGLLLIGAEGVGKLHVAQWLASQLGADTFIVASLSDKNVITIEQVRKLYTVTRTGRKLAIIIEDSHELGIEAQNAFLKLLEEPPKHTIFILTTHNAIKLLDTIRSRTQHIVVYPPDEELLLNQATISSTIQTNELKALLTSSQKLPGRFFKTLLDEDVYQQHQSRVAEAKSFYRGTVFERHILCVENKYDREWAKALLSILSVILDTLLKQNVRNTTAIKKLSRQSMAIEEASAHLFQMNGNPKIHLTKLCSELG